MRNEIIWNYKKDIRMPDARVSTASMTPFIFLYKGEKQFFQVQYNEMLPERKKQGIKAGFNTKNLNGEKYKRYL